MNSPSEFLSDVCVIGRGLLGSAAAHHLSEMGVNVSPSGRMNPLRVRSTQVFLEATTTLVALLESSTLTFTAVK